MKYAGLKLNVCTFCSYVCDWLFHITLKLDLSNYHAEEQMVSCLFNACIKYLIIYHELINTYIPHFKFLHKKHFWFIFSLNVKKKILKIK